MEYLEYFLGVVVSGVMYFVGYLHGRAAMRQRFKAVLEARAKAWGGESQVAGDL